MQRTLQPELLDSLPHDHPDAQRNRRDLRLTNALLGNHRWLARTLPRLVEPGELVLELGAGTGELGRRLHREKIGVDGLDVCPRPPDWPVGRLWHQADLRTFAGFDAYAAVVGNLIFHQFSDEELAKLGDSLRRHVRVVVACEPQRRRLSQFFYRHLGPLFGTNHVSLHDAHVSIAAGFCSDELPRTLGFAAPDWEINCSSTLRGLNRTIAVRRG